MPSNYQATDDFAIRLGDSLLRAGASSASTTTSLLAVYRRSDVIDVSVAVTMGQVTISHAGRDGATPSTRVNETATGTLDVGLRSETNRILEDFVLGHIDAEEGLRALNELEAQRSHASHWPSVLGYTALGLGFSLVLGGNTVTTIAATLLSAAVYGAFALLERLRAPGIFSLGAGGMMAVAGASVVTVLFDDVQTAVCIVAALAAWLAGIAAYGAVQDLITGWYLSATGRLMDVITRTAGLVAGVALGIHLIEPLLGSDPGYLESLQADSSRWIPSIIGAVFVSAGFALSAGGRGKVLASLGLFGGLVQLSVLIMGAAGMSSFASILTASVVAGALCVVLTRALDLASNATMTVVLLPLFPGMYVYQGLLGTIFATEGAGAAMLQGAITAFCLSVGGLLGQYIASEALWATRARQFARAHPGRTFRKEVPDEVNSSDIMVPVFSRPFTH
ncbi:threonine/serine exporter ThrE family protein [Kocuria palustris]|uniref:threonine/serine ThrE exporter family protein n=1 Tax=Kocuria palustris TaxID=71999 RepID=UPI001642B247|nr:threonine/serine exporter family protein [Kocuria palustris]